MANKAQRGLLAGSPRGSEASAPLVKTDLGNEQFAEGVQLMRLGGRDVRLLEVLKEIVTEVRLIRLALEREIGDLFEEGN